MIDAMLTEESLVVPPLDEKPVISNETESVQVEKVGKKKAVRKPSQYNLFVGKCMKDSKGRGQVKAIFKAATEAYKKVAAKEMDFETGVLELQKRIHDGEFAPSSVNSSEN